MGVLLLQVLQEGLPLLVHVRRLHGQDLPGAAGSPQRVPTGDGPAAFGVPLRSPIRGRLPAADVLRVLRGRHLQVAFGLL